jgi:hypothetical protein
MVWLVLNVFVFPPVENPVTWVSKGIYGEQLWLKKRGSLPKHYDVGQRYLIVLGLAGMMVIAAGLTLLDVWLSVLGASVLILAQLWRIDWFSSLFDIYAKVD